MPMAKLYLLPRMVPRRVAHPIMGGGIGIYTSLIYLAAQLTVAYQSPSLRVTHHPRVDLNVMTRSRHRERSVAIQSYKLNTDANHWIVTLLRSSQRRLTKLKLSAMFKVSSLEGASRRGSPVKLINMKLITGSPHPLRGFAKTEVQLYLYAHKSFIQKMCRYLWGGGWRWNAYHKKVNKFLKFKNNLCYAFYKQYAFQQKVALCK